MWLHPRHLGPGVALPAQAFAAPEPKLDHGRVGTPETYREPALGRLPAAAVIGRLPLCGRSCHCCRIVARIVAALTGRQVGMSRPRQEPALHLARPSCSRPAAEILPFKKKAPSTNTTGPCEDQRGGTI